MKLKTKATYRMLPPYDGHAFVDFLAEHGDKSLVAVNHRVTGEVITALEMAPPPWLQVWLAPAALTGWWWAAVIDAGTAEMRYQRVPHRADWMPDYLAYEGVDEAQFRVEDAAPATHCPWRVSRPSKPKGRSVYFIQPVGGGLIKIGVAGSVASRLSAMQTGSPVQLRIIGVIPEVSQDRETELHHRFSTARSHGEWFRPVPELLAYIAENASPA